MTTAENALDLLDLDAQRAARREGADEGLPVRLGGQVFVLPSELPVDALSPIEAIGEDLGFLLREAAVAASGDRSAGQIGTQLLDLIVTKPDLPKGVVAAVKEVLASLFGPEQWSAFLAKRPSIQDCTTLFRGLFRAYGVSLGEASRSTEPAADGGPPSSATSSGTTDSTPEASTPAPVAAAS